MEMDDLDKTVRSKHQIDHISTKFYRVRNIWAILNIYREILSESFIYLLLTNDPVVLKQIELTIQFELNVIIRLN
jgi:hypothetical protein